MDQPSAFPLEPLPVHSEPFDFILKEGFLRQDVYRELERSFPACPPSTGPTGFSYYWGDPEYEDLIANNWAWKSFFHNRSIPSLLLGAIFRFAAAFSSCDTILLSGA